jgi:hypothetical protein
MRHLIFLAPAEAGAEERAPAAAAPAVTAAAFFKKFLLFIYSSLFQANKARLAYAFFWNKIA